MRLAACSWKPVHGSTGARKEIFVKFMMYVGRAYFIQALSTIHPSGLPGGFPNSLYRYRYLLLPVNVPSNEKPPQERGLN
jgi:hypothetical protein